MNKFFLSKFNFKFLLIIMVFFSLFNEKNYSFEENLILDQTYLDKKVKQPYILGGGDLIRINVYEFLPKLEKLYRIDGEGEIFIPDLGSLYVSGLTTQELEKILTEKFTDVLYQSNVTVNVMQYRNLKIMIKGEVNSPGLIRLKGEGENQTISKLTTEKDPVSLGINTNINNLEDYPYLNKDFPTLYEAIRKAGGITLNADLENIEVIRKNPISKGGGLIKANINLLEFINNKNSLSNIRIFDDDMIHIKKGNKLDLSTIKKAMNTSLNPKFIEVFVTGKVQKSGKYTFSKISTLNDAIEFAGGKKPVSGKVTLSRIQGDGEVIKKTFKYRKTSKRGSELNPYLLDGDIINVNQSGFNKATSIINEVTAPISGLVNTYYLYKIFE